MVLQVTSRVSAPNNSIALVGLNTGSPVVNFGGTNIPNYAVTQNANPNLRVGNRLNRQTEV